jgi:hypothetical protein
MSVEVVIGLFAPQFYAPVAGATLGRIVLLLR